MRISLIIPVFNTEAWLPRCLESVASQGVPAEDYEIVIVNDGSNDGSEAVAAEFAAGRSNVRIISQANAGLSAARNAGLAAAGGDYVWFVDSDDRIAEDCLVKILDICSSLSPDIVALGSARERSSGLRQDRYYPASLAGKTLSGAQMMRRGLLKSVCSPFYVFRKQYLLDGGLSFMPGIFHEDEEFTPRALYGAAIVAFLPEICYFACYRPGSITRKPNPKRSYDLITVAEALEDYSKTIPKKDRWLISKRITDVINASLKLTRSYSLEEREAFQDKLYEKRRLFKHFARSGKARFIAEGWILQMVPANSIYAYRFLQGSASYLGLSTEQKK